MSDEKTLLLVDGSSYLFRAYYALPELTNSKGQQTGAVYGVMNMLRKQQKQIKTSHVAIVFDCKGKTFRHKMYPEYKANRAVMPDDLQQQIKPLHQLIQDFGYPLLLKPGVEADDVIGSLAQQALRQGYRVIISTGDKDFAQLVQPKLTLINTMTGVKLDEAGVKEKFGVPPNLIVDYLALMGDNVDNVPGVPKVGPKTAVKWLQKYHSLDAIMQHADEFGGKVGENLRDSLDFLPMARDLVTIAQDIELTETVEDLVLRPPQRQRILKRVQELEFRTWSKEFANDSPLAEGVDAAAAEHGAHTVSSAREAVAHGHAHSKYEMVDSEEQLQAWIKRLQQAKCFAIDTETTSLNPMQADLVGISLAVAPGEAVYIPLRHTASAPQLKPEQVLQALQPFLQSKDCLVIGQNIKYDYKVLAAAGLTISAPMWDTMLASYVLDSSRRSHSLDALAKDILNLQTMSYEDVAGKGAKQVCFSEVPLDIATQYAAEDADVTFQLYLHLDQILKKNKNLQHIFDTMEMPLVTILAEMEMRGVFIDSAMLQQQSRDLSARIKRLEKVIYNEAGETFNVNSPKQLQAVLYDKLGLPVLKKTPTGQPATSEPVLQRLADEYELPEKILDFRSLSKLKSTYTDRLPQQLNHDTGRVHTSYHQTGTNTGRLSSSDPNLQNIPVRTEDGRKVRQAFIAQKDYCLVSADYSQVELRLMAHFSGDEGLLKAFAQDIDIHQATAAKVFAQPLEQVSADMRRQAKAINFGLMYGMSAFGLAQQLNIPRKQAAEFIDAYFAQYPQVGTYLDQVRQQAVEQGYVETICGRKIMLPDANSKQPARRAAAERAAINAPLQGSAADMIKLAMIKLADNMKFQSLRVHLVMQVHDELVFEVHKDDCEKAVKCIVQAMEGALRLDVPLKVSIGQGENWQQAH